MTQGTATPLSRTPIYNIRIATLNIPMAVRAAWQLGLFTPLAGGLMTAKELAKFLTVSDGCFGNTDMTAYYFVEGLPK